MKQFITILTLFVTISLHAQTVVATLEDITVLRDSFLNAKNVNGSFQSANAIFPNVYTARFDASSGWAISSKKDSVTADFTNQYSAKTGSGFNGSPNYAVTFDESTIRFTGRVRLDSFYVTNSTYTYGVIRDGNQFSKRFGGETGNDPDFFRLNIFKYLNGVRSRDSVVFYLADFRFANRAQDYIVRDWRAVNLTALGEADSLLFTFASSDVGSFGINTPLYFCLDNLTTRPVMTDLNDKLAEKLDFKIFPNPATEFVQVTWEGNETGAMQLLDVNGRLVFQQKMDNQTIVNMQDLPKGVYFIRINIENQIFTKKIVKQ